MLNQNAVMDYILACLRGMVASDVDIEPDSDLVDELGLESIRVMLSLIHI